MVREQGDQTGILSTLTLLGLVASWQGDYEAARSPLNEGEALARTLGNQQYLSHALAFRGLLAAFEGEREAAHRFLAEALSIARGLGRMTVAISLNILGYLCSWENNDDQAYRVLDESLEIARELGINHMVCWSLNNRGRVAALRGDLAAAQSFHEQSLSRAGVTGETLNIVDSLEGLARVTLLGDPESRALEKAARLLGAAQRLREASELPLPAIARAEHDRLVEGFRCHLGAQAFAGAWEEGRSLPLADVFALASQGTRPA